MMVSLATAEARVIALVQEERALEMRTICAGAACCRMTVFRGLKRYGYFTSYNCNSSYYTLHDIPEFDGRGLWQYGPARFSRHGTIAETVLAWVQESLTRHRRIVEALRTRNGDLAAEVVSQCLNEASMRLLTMLAPVAGAPTATINPTDPPSAPR